MIGMIAIKRCSLLKMRMSINRVLYCLLNQVVEDLVVPRIEVRLTGTEQWFQCQFEVIDRRDPPELLVSSLEVRLQARERRELGKLTNSL